MHPTLTEPKGALKAPGSAKKLNNLKQPHGAHRVPEVVLFLDRDFGGKQWRTNISYNSLGEWNDAISSIIVVSGTWRFFRHLDCKGEHWDLGPGYYEWLPDHDIPNDVLSSFEPIAW